MKIVETNNNQRGLSICKNNYANLLTTSTFDNLKKEKKSLKHDTLCMNFIKESLDHCYNITNLHENEIKIMIASRKINTLYSYILNKRTENIKPLLNEILN